MTPLDARYNHAKNDVERHCQKAKACALEIAAEFDRAFIRKDLLFGKMDSLYRSMHDVNEAMVTVQLIEEIQSQES